MRSFNTRHVSLCLTSIALCLGCGEESDGAGTGSTDLDGMPTASAPSPTVTTTSSTPSAGPTGTGNPSPTPSSSAPATPNGPTAGPTPTVAPGPTASGPSGPTAAVGPSGPTAPIAPTSVTPVGPENPDPGPQPTGNDGAGGMPVVDMPDVDEGGKMNAARGARSDVPQDYLRMGDIRILNNNWGSEDLGCFAPNSTMAVFVNDDGRFGWEFNRGDCADAMDSSHPDFPQLEFGIHPFGIGSNLATSPEFSSTTLMPIQLGAINSASITVEDLRIELQNGSSWNITMEFWLSEGNPLEPNPRVYAEIMTFWGWQGGRWPSAPGADGSAEGGSGTGDKVTAGNKSYTLWVQRDQWADGWRYFQFRADDGPQQSFNGTIDIKALLEYLKGRPNNQYPDTLWLTRMEVGSEIDDNTSGKVSMSGITFEVNGESRSHVIAP